MACVHCWGCGDGTGGRWLSLLLTSQRSPWCWQSTDLRQTGGEHISLIRVLTVWLLWTMSVPPSKPPKPTNRYTHVHRQNENGPIRGTESEVAGIISATISMKTVRESRTVMPGGRHKTPGSSGLQRKRREKKKVHEYTQCYSIFGMLHLTSRYVFLTLLRKFIRF